LPGVYECILFSIQTKNKKNRRQFAVYVDILVFLKSVERVGVLRVKGNWDPKAKLLKIIGITCGKM